MILSLAYSLYKGFVSEVFSLLSILFASILATRYCFLGEVYLKGIIDNKNITYLIGFILLFLITVVLVRLLGMAINKFIKKVGLSIPNRLLGGGLGIIKGTLLVSVLLLVLIMFSNNGAKNISKTRWAQYFLPISEFVADFLPHSLLNNSKRDYRKIRSLIENQKIKNRIKLQRALEEDKEQLRKILKDNL
jgi:membrane protein required for colicin V production